MSEEPSKDQESTILMEQYKLYVEMMDKVSERRLDTTKLHISLLTLLLGVISLVLTLNVTAEIYILVIAMTGLMGIALCVVWLFNISSYKQLNFLKFKVIHEMEKRMPFACYTREWEILGEDSKQYQYRRLWRIEQLIPLILLIPYLILIAYALIKVL